MSPFDGLPQGHFAAIAVDPPWHFKARTAIQSTNPGSRRDAARHYDTMNLKDIMALPVSSLAAKDCHLFLWTTGPNLKQAFDVIDAWGFRYSTLAFTWVKMRRGSQPQFFYGERDLHFGLGLTTRKNAELVLLARRGNPKRIAKNVREIILAPVREHSRKPDDFYDRVESYCVGPRLELFARSSRPGWVTWGDESTRFDKKCA